MKVLFVRLRLLVAPLALAMALTLSGCSEDDRVLLRVRNSSDRDFEEVFVVSGEPLTAGKYFGNVPSGATSDYRPFDLAYSYGYVRVTSGGEEYTFIPIDYVGEKPLTPGSYTYVLGLSKSIPPQLSVSCEGN